MEFFKYCGAGNDFVLLDNRDGRWTDYPALAIRLCDRHFGVGADGLMLLEQPEQPPYHVRIHSAVLFLSGPVPAGVFPRRLRIGLC